jgi:hypothetical protein
MDTSVLLTSYALEKNFQRTIERPRRMPLLLLKNTCWYCNTPLDTIRRYCDKNCAEAFEEDDNAMERRIRAGQLQWHA